MLNSKKKFGREFLALGLFGSLARNAARAESDLDLLVIFDQLPDGMGARLKLLMPIEEERDLQDELDFLALSGIYPQLSYHPLKVSELDINPFIIDVAFDLKIIYDRNILQKYLLKIQAYIQDYNITRKFLSKDQYYLDFGNSMGEIM